MSDFDASLPVEPSNQDTSTVDGTQAPAGDGTQQQDTPKKLYAGKYESAEEMEKAYEDLQRKLGEQGDEVSRLRALVGQPMPYPQYPAHQYPVNPATVEPQVEIPVSDNEWFGNPQAAATKIYLKAKQDAAEEARRVAREEAMRMAASNQVVNQFYERFPELNNKRDKELVDAFAIKFQNEIAGLNPYQIQQLYPDPMKVVAERVKEYKTAIAEEARAKANTAQPLHVGPGGGATPVAPAAPPKPKTKAELMEDAFAQRLKLNRY